MPWTINICVGRGIFLQLILPIIIFNVKWQNILCVCVCVSTQMEVNRQSLGSNVMKMYLLEVEPSSLSKTKGLGLA